MDSMGYKVQTDMKSEGRARDRAGERGPAWRFGAWAFFVSASFPPYFEANVPYSTSHTKFF